MFKFDETHQTKNFNRNRKNECKYIVLHHTASNNQEGDKRVLLGETTRPVSVHFLIWTDKTYKLSDPALITWHCWKSQRLNDKNLNDMALWIEVTGIDSFNHYQYNQVIALVKHLQQAYKIPRNRILKHCDITRAGSKMWSYYDWVSKSRKPDINRSLRADRWFKNYYSRIISNFS